MDDVKWMKEAIKQAKKAEDYDEVPIGCVIVKDDKIIARGYNKRETLQQSIAHAEIMAIQKACKKLGTWRLEDCVLYVTLEPCPMCASACGWAQLSRVVYGASDDKRGYQRYAPKVLHPKAEVTNGVLKEDCMALMQLFFKRRRD